jgi:basic amino acid/polyamine antiporter, APA family
MKWWQQLWARKSIEDLNAELASENRLHRVLGPIGLTSLGVGAIIGSGIFVTTGRSAALDAGPAILLSYVIAGTACLFAALCYAEFASLAPVAGSAYTYAYATVGELLAWIIGWDLVLEYAMSCACVAASWSEYFNEFLWLTIHWRIPDYLCKDPFSTPGAWLNLPAVAIVFLVSTVLVFGIRESAMTNAILVIMKVGVVIFVILVGWSFVKPENWTSVPVEARLMRANPADGWGILGRYGFHERFGSWDDWTRSSFAPYGISGIILGASRVFYAYLGFDSISTHSEEARHPQRDVPIGILASLVICTVLYVGVSAVITGMEPYPEINQEAAVAAAFRKQAEITGRPLLRASAILISLGALAGMTSVLLITFLSQARIFLAMARDRLLPESVFAAIHPKYRTPHLSTILTGALMAVVAAFTPITKLEEMVNIGTLMAFIMVCTAVLILRIQRPDVPRPFKTPFVFLLAPAGIAINLLLMFFLPFDTWVRLFVWLAIGLVVYFTYGMRRSRLRLRAHT